MLSVLGAPHLVLSNPSTALAGFEVSALLSELLTFTSAFRARSDNCPFIFVPYILISLMDIALLYAMLRHRTFTYLAFPRQTPSDSYTFLSTLSALKPLTVLATVQLVLSFDTRIWKSFGYAFSNIIFTFSISYNFSKSTIR